MKLQPESIDVDLYVSTRRVTEKELKEFGDFIKEYKRKKALNKSKKNLKTA